MLELKLMTQAEFASYSEDAIARYAEENVKAGIWTSADALTNARKAFQDLLPVGLQTRNNLLYSIKQRATGENVGVIWIKILHDRNPYTAYIYDLVIFHAFRKHGYARQVLLAIEGITTDHGAVSIALHVFAHNGVAQRLYLDAGYGISGYAMRKSLGDPEA
jgi:ribosomal protein S18 acetylase RimI-like enzyme